MSLSTIICVGMAGSGKTKFMQRLNSHIRSSENLKEKTGNNKNVPYVINLDPAVLKIPYGCNIDIRDSIKYKKVMENYQLGPNGAIVTSLNLFSTKIDQIIKLVENKKDKHPYCIIDTPGQIECFVWSASGSIITESFASTFPTVLAYIIDTPRNTSPTTFMSNMLYACSILYKTKLPMVIVFNKTDVTKEDFAKEWMTDFESFQNAIREDQENQESMGSGYMSSLINSMSLMLEEFYSTLDMVGVSSYTGAGFDDFLTAVDKKVDEYNEFYKAERDRIIKEKELKEEERKEKSINGLMKDLGLNDKKNNNKNDEEGVDTLSDYEEGENDGLVDRDEDEGIEREYTFANDDRLHGELRNEPDLQERYRQAMEQTAKDVSSETAENIAKYIRQ